MNNENIINMKAYRHFDDGKQWLRIITDQNEWDEPIAGWTEIHDLINGISTYRHDDGREIIAI